MQFGVKAAVEPEYDPDAQPSSGSFIKYFKDQKTTLRFLDEIDDWTSVWMHFSPSKNREYPCTGNKAECPGCNAENEREAKGSKRYITNALNPESGFVDLYKIPMSLKTDFDRQADRFGTIRDRDYSIFKDKVNGKTEYSMDREEKVDLDLSQHEEYIKDHQEALSEAFREVWGALPDEPDYVAPDFLGNDGFTRSGYLPSIKKEETVLPKREIPVDPPTKPAAQRHEEQQEEMTEAQLRAMEFEELIEVFKRAEVPVPSFTDKNDLVDQLIAALS